MFRQLLVVLAVMVLVLCAAGKPKFRPAKGQKKFQRYIVRFTDDSNVDVDYILLHSHFNDGNGQGQGSIRRKFRSSFRGASVENVSPGSLMWMLRQDFIDYIEEVGVFHAVQSVDPDRDPVSMSGGSYFNWGLDRITERTYTSSHSYQPAGTGDNIDIFVLDTGVRLTHEEFESGRAMFLPINELETEDEYCNGHGTQTTGIAGGRDFGTATKAKLTSVKVLDCSGSGASDDVLAGLEAVKSAKPNGIGVVSLPISVEQYSESIHDAIVDLTESGFVLVTAAGNANVDACSSFPAGYKEVLTVGAIDAKGEITSFSNYGDCVQIYAPGSNIYTATNEGDDLIKEVTGTSFAAAFVSGAVAILLQNNVPPSDIKQMIIDMSTVDEIENIANYNTSYNRILYVDTN